MNGEPPPSTPVEPSAEDVEIDRLAQQKRRVRGLRIAALRALALARRYRAEEGPRGEREIASVEQALAWRASARALLAGKVSHEGPGLARTAPPSGNVSRRAG